MADALTLLAQLVRSQQALMKLKTIRRRKATMGATQEELAPIDRTISDMRQVLRLRERALEMYRQQDRQAGQ